MSGIYELLNISPAASKSHGGDQGGRKKPEEHSHGFVSFIKRIHPFMDFFVMLILLCIIAVTLPKSCESNDVKGFSKAVDDFINADRETMGEKGWNFFKNNWSVENGYNIIMKHFE